MSMKSELFQSIEGQTHLAPLRMQSLMLNEPIYIFFRLDLHTTSKHASQPY